MKSSGPASLVEEILGQHQMESLAWLLFISLMQVYNENQQLGRKGNVQILEEKAKDLGKKGSNHIVW